MKTLKLNSFLNLSILFLLYKLISTQPYNNNTMSIDNRLNIDPNNQNNNNNNSAQNEANSIYSKENKNNTNDGFNNGVNFLNNKNIISNSNQTLNNSSNNDYSQQIPYNSSANINNIKIGINVNPINVDEIRQNITKENNFDKLIKNSSLNMNNQNEEIKKNLQPVTKKKSRKIWYIIIFILIAVYIYYYRKKSDSDGVNYSQISKYSYYDF